MDKCAHCGMKLISNGIGNSPNCIRVSCLTSRLAAAEIAIKTMPCYDQWFWSGSSVEKITCAKQNRLSGEYCPACKTLLENE